MRVYATLSVLCLCIVLFSAPALADESAESTNADWDKPYAGVAIGGAYGEADHSLGLGGSYFDTQDRGQFDPMGSRDQSEAMPAASVFVGVNRQWGHLVLGLEGDFTYAPFDRSYDSGRTEYDSLPGKYVNLRSHVKSDWVASLRPRLGYAFDNSLAYLTVGLALSEFEYHFHFDDDNMGGNLTTVDNKRFHLGWTAGVGYDYGLDDGWAIRASYQHYEFPGIAGTASSFTNGVYQGDLDNSLDYKTDIFLIGILKRF